MLIARDDRKKSRTSRMKLEFTRMISLERRSFEETGFGSTSLQEREGASVEVNKGDNKRDTPCSQTSIH